MARLLPPERDIGVLRAPVRSSIALIGVFLAVLLAVGLLDRIGADPGFAPFAIVGAAFVLFILAALYSHSRRATDFYVIDRKASGSFNGLAGASALAGLLAVGIAGGAYDTQASFLLTAIGLAVGYLILGLVIAPGLRAFGAYTAGDFIGARFGGVLARFGWAGITFVVSLLLFVAALKIAAPLVSTVFGLEPKTALYVTAGLTAMAALPGGMRSLSWTQAVQYLVIAIACIVPAAFFASGGPTAQSAMAGQFATLVTESLPAWTEAGAVGWLLPVLLSILGAASLPHLSTRVLTAPSGREAVTSMVWAVLFSIMLVLAGFVLFELLAGEIGPDVAPQGGIVQLAALFALLPSVLAGLLIAGTLAALFSLGQAALFSAATAISHDIWDEIIDRRGPEGRRIMVARVIIVSVAAGAVMLVSIWPADPASLVVWALALAAAGTFVPLALGLWWRRCNEIGAIAGMVAGFGFTALVFLLQQHVIPDAVVTSGWADVAAPPAAAAGLLMSLVVTVGLSLATPAPDKDAQDLANASDDGRLPVRERPA
jgi:cation/acetate symporter